MSSSSRSRSREKHRYKKQTNHLKEEFTSKDERLEDSKQRENTLKTNYRLKFTEETEGIDKHSYKGHYVSVFKEERTHVSCRRCKNLTFSLKTRSCSTCGYPKEYRPAFFPVTKEVQVMDLVRSGKLIHNSYAPVMIYVVVNDRMGKRQRIKCCPTDTILQFKKLISAQIGTRADKIRLQKANVIYKDHLSLEDYEIKDGMGLEMYYD